MSEAFPGYTWVTGVGTVANTDEDKTIIAAQGAGKVVRVMKAVVSVTLVATGGGGLVALEDAAGGTRFFEADADGLGVYVIDFGPRGFPLTANAVLNLTVDGAGTNEASARATIVAYVS